MAPFPNNSPKLRSKAENPLWLWISLVIVILLLIWTGTSWLIPTKIFKEEKIEPFFQVTNRDFSLFFWLVHEDLNHFNKENLGPFSGFYRYKKMVPDPSLAEQNIQTSDEILFFYHLWARLLKDQYFSRPIPIAEFQEFLRYSEEWLPQNWPKAPNEYLQLIQSLSPESSKNLEEESFTALPKEIRQAFQGWKNSFREKDLITDLEITFDEMFNFLESNPQFARNYWRNLFPNYLKSFLDKPAKQEKIKENEMPFFLKTAFFNFKEAKIKEMAIP